MTHPPASNDGPLHIAFVLGEFGKGGTEFQSRILIRGLLSRGHDVDLYVLAGPDTCCRDGFRDMRAARLSARRGGARPLLAGTRLAYELRRQRYDVVHAALARAYVVAPLAAPVHRRPRIVTWRRNLGIHLDGRPAAAALESLASRRSDVIVANSQAVLEYWTKRGHIRAGRGRVIRNALESWRFDEVEPAPTLPDVPDVVSVGSLREVKGQGILVDAMAQIERDARPSVTLLGEGPLRQYLAVTASDLGVRLVLPGAVRDTRGWLAAATIYVHPSLSEGASNAIAEAMAQGCAIVSTDVGGASEMLRGCGVLVPPNDRDALARVVRALLDDPDRRHFLGVRARRRAYELFDADRVVQQHVDIYRGT